MFTVLYVNRATCFVKMQAWGRAQQDCETALRRDPANMQVSTTHSAHTPPNIRMLQGVQAEQPS